MQRVADMVPLPLLISFPPFVHSTFINRYYAHVMLMYDLHTGTLSEDDFLR